MQAPAGHDSAFAFGPYTFMPSRQILLRGRRPLRLGARALDVLHLLVLRTGEAVSKEELIEFTWPNTVVDQGNLKVHISSLRRALGETSPHPTYIATVAGRGYRFVAPVSMQRADPSGRSYAIEPDGDMLPPRKAVVGRDREILEVERALDEAALVTLIGPGGVGKTTVAVEVAHRKSTEFSDGVCFVDLSCTCDLSLVPHLVATALGLRGRPADVTSSIVDHLKERPILVLLDNCEHVLPAVAMLIARLREAGVSARVLATSRESIGGIGEVVQRILPLDCPGDGEAGASGDAMAYPSMELFALRASEKAAYAITDEDVPAVARMCALLDGLPLAIEVVAARLEKATPAELLLSLEGLFRQLLLEKRGDHQAPLWAAFDWSFRLLSDHEATTYKLLSVFAGEFDSTDVVVMTGLVGYDPYQTTVAIGRLVAKSLVVATLAGGSIAYRLLEGSRRYSAQALLDDAPLHRRAHAEHARLMRSILGRSEEEWYWTDTRAWCRRYERRLGDVRQALDWCFGSGEEPALGVDLTTSAIKVWNEQSSVFEQMTQVERALSLTSSTPGQASQRARLAISRAWSLTLARQLGPETDEAWRSAMEMAQGDVEPILRISAMSGSATYLVYAGRCVQAVERLTQCIAIADGSGDPASLFESRRRMAFAELHVGSLVSARDRSEALAKDLDLGLQPSRVTRYKEERHVGIQSALALASWLMGASDRAVGLVDEMIERTGGSRQQLGQSHILALVALPIALWRDDVEALNRGTATLRRNLETSNIAIWAGVCRFYEVFCRHAAGREDAVAEMETAVDDLVRDGLLVRVPMYLVLLAEARLARHDVDGAARSIERALDIQMRSGERWCLPELLRVKAQVAAERLDDAGARHLLLKAQTAAEEMGGRFFQLRAAVDLASLPGSTEDRAQAMIRLQAVHAAFRGVSRFPDLARARDLLDGERASTPT